MTALTATNPLDIRTCIIQIQSALVDVLDLAYGYRYPEVQTLDELANAPSLQMPDRALRFVVAEGVVYRLVYGSRLASNSPYVIQPTDRNDTTAGGRWIRQSSSVTLGPNYHRPLHRVRYGYAKAVEAYQGQTEEQLNRIYAERPAYLIEYIGDTLHINGYAPGTIYEFDLDFVVHCLSANYRPGQEALYGSEYANETDRAPGEPGSRTHDPGLYRMMGDVRYLLAGCDLGLAPGVKTADIQGQGKITGEDLAQRTFFAEVPVKVWASVHVVDEDLVSPIEVWIQRQDANAVSNGGEFDRGNYVAKGYTIAPCPGLVAGPIAGVAYIRGQLVTSAPGVHTFPPDADTYRDLFLDGQLFYQSVDIDAEAPEQPPNTLRLGLTRTDASNITNDVLLCSYAVDSGADPGDPFRAA